MSDAGCFVVQAHKVLFHLSVRCLKILINSIDLMWCLRYLVSGWCKKRIFWCGNSETCLEVAGGCFITIPELSEDRGPGRAQITSENVTSESCI